jgi:hypothetical protein
MDEVRDRARLVDASAFDGRGVTATVPRADIEGVLASADGPPELVLDVQRREGDEVEAHTLRIEWDPKELEELLRTTSDEQVTLVLDRDELERAIQADVEAHGLREKAAVFGVAAIAAASVGVSQAAAGHTAPYATGGGGAAPIEMVSDAASSGPSTTGSPLTAAQSDANMLQVAAASESAATGPEMISDAAMSGPSTTGSPLTAAQSDSNILQVAAASQSAAEGPELVTDASTTGPVPIQAAAQSPEQVSDSALSGPAGSPMTPQQIVDAAAPPPEMVSDAALSGPVAQPEASGGGGWDISAPDSTTTGIIAGGIALMITAAGFAVRGQRRQVGHPA